MYTHTQAHAHTHKTIKSLKLVVLFYRVAGSLLSPTTFLKLTISSFTEILKHPICAPRLCKLYFNCRVGKIIFRAEFLKSNGRAQWVKALYQNLRLEFGFWVLHGRRRAWFLQAALWPRYMCAMYGTCAPLIFMHIHTYIHTGINECRKNNRQA